MELAESPAPPAFRAAEVVPLDACAYACPGCPVGRADAPRPPATRSPLLRLAGAASCAAAAARRAPKGTWIEWWGPPNASESELEEMARAGVRGVGFVALGLDRAGAAARGWRGGDEPPAFESWKGRLAAARRAGLRARLALPEVSESRYDAGMRIGWQDASLLQRAAWEASSEAVLSAAPVCFGARR